MYESHFGLSAPPFQLGPDPGFYFDSKGHHHALAYLRFGAYQGEGFIVVTGEIGAGKTTLVRTLLAELDTSKVVAAQIVSTQLEAGDLLRAILLAFGVNCSGLTKAQLIGSLEAFLTLLVTRGQRALLIVDEAQNLSLEAVEEMRMLSNFQFGNHALLQSFLVGQPELRRLLQSRSMEQLRQRVIASCHLGPLDPQETRAYIVHRLTKVGWTGRPSFTPDSFEAIHSSTAGIPRRINVLCNRLLLGAFLGGGEQISAASVQEVAGDLQSELGEPLNVSSGPVAAAARSGSKAELATLPPTGDAGRIQAPERWRLARPLLLVADSALDVLKMRILATGMFDAGLAVTPTLVASSGLGGGGVSLAGHSVPAGAPDVLLEVDSMEDSGRLAQALILIDARIAEMQPFAMVVIGSGDIVLACCLAATRRGLPVLRIDAGLRPGDSHLGASHNAALIDLLASRLLSASDEATEVLRREGMAGKVTQCDGALVSGVLDAMRGSVSDVGDVLRRVGATASGFDVRRAFALCALKPDPSGEIPARIEALFRLLAGRASILWLVHGDAADALRSSGAASRLRQQGVTLVAMPELPDVVALLARARFVVDEVGTALAELAAALGVPLLTLDTAGTGVDEQIAAADEVLGRDPALPRSAQAGRAGPLIDKVVGWVEGLDVPTEPVRRVDFGSAGRR